MQGYTFFFPIAYSATDVAIYQQDVVIHRSEGEGHQEERSGLKIWHVYVGNRCKSDYGDIRFTDASGNALAYYLWPDYDAESARFTVRLEGADQSGELLVWYGNPTATTTSDGDATYDLWCDFLDAGEVAAVFDVVGTPDTTYADSVATITCNAREFYQSKKTFSRPARVEFRMADTGYGADQYPSATGFGVRNQGGGGYHVLREAMTTAQYGLSSCNGGATAISNFLPHDLTFQKYRIDWASGTSAALLKNDAVIASVSTQIPTGPLPVTFGRFHYYLSGNQMKIDWILVRAYSAAPPAATAFGPEQASGTLPAAPSYLVPGARRFGSSRFSILGTRQSRVIEVAGESATVDATRSFAAAPRTVTVEIPLEVWLDAQAYLGAAPSYLVPGARRFGLSRFSILGTLQSRAAGVEGAGAALDAERGILVAADRLAAIAGLGGYLAGRSYAVPDVSGGVSVAFEEVSGGVSAAFEEVYPI